MLKCKNFEKLSKIFEKVQTVLKECKSLGKILKFILKEIKRGQLFDRLPLQFKYVVFKHIWFDSHHEISIIVGTI